MTPDRQYLIDAIKPECWDGSWLRTSFRCWNVGLALMVLVSVPPVGFI